MKRLKNVAPRRDIVGVALDRHGSFVAVLDCGHTLEILVPIVTGKLACKSCFELRKHELRKLILPFGYFAQGSISKRLVRP